MGEYIAEKSHGFSGADLANIGKQAARERAEALGEPYESDDEDEANPEDAMITQRMLEIALDETNKSVTAEQYQKYLDMKERFERESGNKKGGVSGLNPVAQAPANPTSSVPAAGPAAAQPSLQDDSDDSDDIYG